MRCDFTLLPILKEEPVIFEFRIPWLFLLSIWSWLTYLILLLFIVVYWKLLAY